jgi:hypothetical protein
MGKIIITGPGRSGTTFLVQLLTRLGFDTGFTSGAEPYAEMLRAGCEWHMTFNTQLETPAAIKARIDAAPQVLKSPDWSLVLKWLLGNGLIEVDHVLLPLRDIDTAARSRLAVGLDWMVASHLDGDERIQDQATIMAMSVGRTVEACVLFEVPCTILRFPSLVTDPAYCYRKLRGIVDQDYNEFLEAWTQLSRPQQIRTA